MRVSKWTSNTTGNRLELHLYTGSAFVCVEQDRDDDYVVYSCACVDVAGNDNVVELFVREKEKSSL